MAKGDNECIPLYEPGAAISARAEAAVTGCRFVTISDPKDGPPLDPTGLSSTVEGQNIVVSHATAAGPIIGVASYDAGIGEHLYVVRGCVAPVKAGSAITAGNEVEVGTTGQAIPLASGKAVGIAVDSIASGAVGPIALYS